MLGCLNIRGQDSEYTPIPHGYVLIDIKFFKEYFFFVIIKKNISYFAEKKISKKLISLTLNIDDYLLKINIKKFIIDRNSCSIYFEDLILKKTKY